MIEILKNFLEKKGISSWEDLNEQEKQTFREWEKILQGKEITSVEVQEALKNRKEILLNELLNPELSETKWVVYTAELRILQHILGMLNLQATNAKTLKNWLEEEGK